MANIMNIGKGKTVRLYTLDRTDNRQIGKIVPYGGSMIYASTFSPEHTKQKDAHRVGINLAVLEYCRQLGMDRFIVIDSKGHLPRSMYQPAAYVTSYDKFRKFGTFGNGGKWGTIVNLADKYWLEMLIPKLPYISDPKDSVPVYATDGQWSGVAA